MPEPQEIAVDLTFPIKGLDQSKGYESQPAGTTHNAVNVRNFEALTRRGRGGSRQFLTRYVDDQLPGYIQNLNFVVEHKGEAVLGSIDGFPPFVSFGDLGVVTNWIPDPSSAFNTLGEVRNRGGWVPTGGTGVTVVWPKKKPVKIIWHDPPDMNDGDDLDGRQLNAQAVDATDGSHINGEYRYKPAFGYTVHKANKTGTRIALNVTFTPEFLVSDVYDPKSKTVHVNIREDTGHNWDNPDPPPASFLNVTADFATETVGSLLYGVWTYTVRGGNGAGGRVRLTYDIGTSTGNTGSFTGPFNGSTSNTFTIVLGALVNNPHGSASTSWKYSKDGSFAPEDASGMETGSY